MVRESAMKCVLTNLLLQADPKRYQHILNAIKYSTSIFPLCLSAYQQTIDHEQAQKREPVLIWLLT